MTTTYAGQQNGVVEKKDIVIITDFEEGHFYPLFRIARNFEEAGYSTCFVSILDTLEIIEKNGFQCIPIFKKVFPRGYVKSLKDNGISTESISPNLYMQSLLEELDAFMPLVQPKIVLTSYFFSLGTLIIHYKYRVQQITFHTLFPPLSSKSDTSLRQCSANHAIRTFMELNGPLAGFFMSFFENNNKTFKSLEDMLAPFQEIPQIMLCPKQLNIENSVPAENEIYLGPCISPNNNIQKVFLQEVLERKGHRKLIYVSMGSQTKEYPKKAEKLFNMMLGAMKSINLKDFHLILSLGSDIENWDLVELPENADVFSWVPQLDILKLTSIAIIHGGLGSIKECIHSGVPMLIVPMGRDQADNAERIEYHQIGYSISFDTITKEIIAEKLIELFENQDRKGNLVQMQRIFEEIENQKNEVKLVRGIIGEKTD